MPSSLRYFKKPETLRYDPAVRDYVVLSNGSTGTMHYVDQRVALSLSIIQGTLSGDSGLGNKLRKIKKFNTVDATADAKRAVSVALQDIINDGEITLKDIVVSFPVRGRMIVEVKYINEILSKSLQPKIESVTLGGSLRMADLVLYSTDQVRDTYLRDFKLRLPGASTSRGTAPYVDAVTVSGLAPALYKNASIAADRQLISRTFGTELDTMANDRKRPRLQGSGSVAPVSINTSITGATIPIGTIGKHVDTGESFETTSATGVYFTGTPINVKSVGVGRQTNVSGKIVWQSPPPGLAVEATIIGNAIGGADIESDTDLQLRLQQLLSDPPADGNTGSYLDYICSSEHGVPVDQAFVIPSIVGPGSIGVTFTVRGSGTGRIPTAGHLSAVETYLKSKVPDDDCIFMLAVNQAASIGRTPIIGVRFVPGSTGFVDPDFFPKYDVPSGAGAWTISNITTPTPLSFSIRNATNTYTNSGIRNGQTLALWNNVSKKFVNKRILSFTGTGPFTITVDQSINASDTVYTPGFGQYVSPWSDKLNDLSKEIVSYYDKLSPGEDVVTFPDPGNRQRRYPPDTIETPYTITTQMISTIQDRSDILSVNIITGSGAAPLGSNSGGVFVNMIFLNDLAIYGV